MKVRSKLAGLPKTELDKIFEAQKLEQGWAGDSRRKEFWIGFEEKALKRRAEIDQQI